MLVVYVSHPLTAPTREEFQENRRAAARWVAKIAKELGVAPIADWITLSGEWSEEDGRARGLRIDCAQIERCDALIRVGTVEAAMKSAGMDVEREHALKFGLPVIDLVGLEFEIPMSQVLTDNNAATLRRAPNGSTHALLTGEVLRARRKFPGSRFMLAALGEEYGELCQAIIQKKHPDEIRKEALQVACCAVRMLEEGDPSFDTITDAEANGV